MKIALGFRRAIRRRSDAALSAKSTGMLILAPSDRMEHLGRPAKPSARRNEFRRKSTAIGIYSASRPHQRYLKLPHTRLFRKVQMGLYQQPENSL